MLHIDVYCASIATFACSRSKRNAAAAGLEGAAAAAGSAGLRADPGGDRPGRRPGVAKPGRIRMSLRAMKSVHEPVVVGLAGMVQEQPATRLAGIAPAEIYINMQKNINMQLYALNMQKICKNIDCISQICKKQAQNMPEICLNMQVICRYMLKICRYHDGQ